MVLRDTASIPASTGTSRSPNGYETLTWDLNSLTPFPCEFMYLSGDTQRREFGIDDSSVVALVFCRNRTDLTEKMPIFINAPIQNIINKQFILEFVKPFKTHFELALKIR